MSIFSRWWRERDVTAAVESVLDSKLRDTITSLRSVDELMEQKLELRESLDTMRREKETLATDIERERLAMQHKLGLEALRQKAEAEIAAREIASERKTMKEEQDVAVRAATLKAKTDATKEARDQMLELQDRQERMISKLMEALPNAQHIHRTGGPDIAIGK